VIEVLMAYCCDPAREAADSFATKSVCCKYRI